jgi:exodeoxyribonuclease VII small subunit
MTKIKSKISADNELQSFENQLDALQHLVESMENQQLPLEQLIQHYEQGTQLLKNCEAMLKTAKERIEIITLKAENPSAE